jgi:hypothetical protein
MKNRRVRFIGGTASSILLCGLLACIPLDQVFAGASAGGSDKGDSCSNGSGGGNGSPSSSAGDTSSNGGGTLGQLLSASALGCKECAEPGGGGGKKGGTGGNGSGCSSCQGMPVWEVSEPMINVWLYDEPLSYQPGLGPKISLKLTYKQRETRTFYTGISENYTGLGPNWHCSWVSYLYRNYNTNGGTTNYDGTATVVMSDGGERTFVSDGSSIEYFCRGTMTNTTNPDGSWNSAVITYPDGSKEEYSQVTSSPWRVGASEILFRTAQYDRFSNATRFVYDSTLPLLTFVIDADGRTNTLYYGKFVPSVNRLTRVDDPFGRSVIIGYGFATPPAIPKLSSISDPEGLSSTFAYDANAWVTNLTTPYGNTKFEYVDNGFAVGSGVIRAARVDDAAGGTNVFMLTQCSGLSSIPVPNIDRA